VNPSIGAWIETTLLHCNTSQQKIEGLKYDSVDQQQQISRLLLLNRYGQNFVASNPRSIPMELWGDVLMRIGKEDSNYFVTELVRRAVEGQMMR